MITPCGRVSAVAGGAAGSAAAAATGCGAGGVVVVAHAVAKRRAKIEKYRIREIVANVVNPSPPALPAAAWSGASPTRFRQSTWRDVRRTRTAAAASSASAGAWRAHLGLA